MAKNLTVLKMADNATTKVTSLIINKVSRNKYKALSDASAILDSELYVVKDVTLNAVKKPVSNVIMTGQNEAEVFPATPNPGLSEAANKKYVDDVAKDIKENLIGSLIYKGHITLGYPGGVPAVTPDGKHLVAGSSLKDIFSAYIQNTMGKTEAEALEYEIGNGSTYQFTFHANIEDTEYTTTETEGEGIKLTNKDYIIINNHVLQGKVKVKDINRDNIDIIDIKYDTLVQRAEFDTKVTELQNKDTALETSINTNTTNIGVNTAAIAKEVTDRTNADDALQTAITTEKETREASEQTIIDRISAAESSITTLDGAAVKKNGTGGISVNDVAATSVDVSGNVVVKSGASNIVTVNPTEGSVKYDAFGKTAGAIKLFPTAGTDGIIIGSASDSTGKPLKKTIDDQIDAKLDPKVQELQESISANTTAIEGHSGEISTLQTTTTELSTSINTVSQNLGTLDTRESGHYTDLSRQISELAQTTATEINTKFTNIKEAVKGQNLQVDIMTDSDIRNCIALLWEFFGGTVVREYTEAEYTAGVKVNRVKTTVEGVSVWSEGVIGVVGKSYKVVVENGNQYWTTEFTGV